MLSKVSGISALLLIFMLQSCILLTGPSQDEKYAQENFTVENGCIPPEFSKTEGTLLIILKNSEKYDKRVKESFAEYNGKHEFVFFKQLENAPYTDLDEYQYVFSYSGESRDYTSEGASGQMQQGSFNVRRFYVLDRKDDKYYRANTTSSFFHSLINGYVYNLNLELAK